MAPWLMVSDDEPGHPQHASLSDRARVVHLNGRCHCARYTTDGIIADARQIQRYSAPVVRELVAASLWRHLEGHKYEIVDYLETQRSRADVEAARAKNRERQERFRKGHSNATDNTAITSLLTGPHSQAHSQAPLRDPEPVPNQRQKLLLGDRSLSEEFRAAHELHLGDLQWPDASLEECQQLAGVLDNDREKLNRVIVKAFESFWNPNGRGTTPPSIGELAINGEKRQKLLAGSFVEQGRRWACRLCAHPHPPLELCQRCEHCQRHHPLALVCDSKKRHDEAERVRQDQVRAEAEEREAAEAEGITVDELRDRRRADHRARVAALLAPIKERAYQRAGQ